MEHPELMADAVTLSMSKFELQKVPQELKLHLFSVGLTANEEGSFDAPNPLEVSVPGADYIREQAGFGG